MRTGLVLLLAATSSMATAQAVDRSGRERSGGVDCAAIGSPAALPPVQLGVINGGILDDRGGLHRLDVPGGQQVRLDAHGDRFDSYLTACRAEGTGYVKAAENDDGPSGTSARLSLGPGRYVVVVTALGGGSAGQGYDLLARQVKLVPPPAARPLAVGTVAEGRLQAGQAAHFLLSADVGSLYEVSVRSSAFDTLLELREAGQPVDSEALAQDDDGGSGTDSLLTVGAEKPGGYRLTVRALGDGQGDFTIEARRFMPTPLATGTSAHRFEGASRNAAFSFEAAPDTVYLIEMKSDALDSVVEISRPGSPDILARDDDSGGSRNARLLFVPPAPGSYMLAAKSLNEAGAYDLSIAPYRRADR